MRLSPSESNRHYNNNRDKGLIFSHGDTNPTTTGETLERSAKLRLILGLLLLDLSAILIRSMVLLRPIVPFGLPLAVFMAVFKFGIYGSSLKAFDLLVWWIHYAEDRDYTERDRVLALFLFVIFLIIIEIPTWITALMF